MKLPEYFYFRVKMINHGTGVIEDASDADVVEVVRCNDCKYFRGDGFECYWGMFAYEDDYCSNGERRKDEGKGV